ncbi:hypothetical protein RDI58_011311 [Solanum bulbocastanum]|uniref:Uncharacterized protein n=1 Tax=Solanum bulbocastanum TaxID=147425 RepID=A0AAN8TQU7_SOLBU
MTFGGKSNLEILVFDLIIEPGKEHFTEGEMAQDDELEVKQFIRNNEWDEDKLRSVISDEMVQHILLNIRPNSMEGSTDRAWWVHSSTEDFTVKSAYQIIRGKITEKSWSKHKGSFFQDSFFFFEAFGGGE